MFFSKDIFSRTNRLISKSAFSRIMRLIIGIYREYFCRTIRVRISPVFKEYFFRDYQDNNNAFIIFLSKYLSTVGLITYDLKKTAKKHIKRLIIVDFEIIIFFKDVETNNLGFHFPGHSFL